MPGQWSYSLSRASAWTTAIVPHLHFSFFLLYSKQTSSWSWFNISSDNVAPDPSLVKQDSYFWYFSRTFQQASFPFRKKQDTVIACKGMQPNQCRASWRSRLPRKIGVLAFPFPLFPLSQLQKWTSWNWLKNNHKLHRTEHLRKKKLWNHWKKRTNIVITSADNAGKVVVTMSLNTLIAFWNFERENARRIFARRKTFSQNSVTSSLYLIMQFSSQWTSHHCIPTSTTMKERMPATRC